MIMTMSRLKRLVTEIVLNQAGEFSDKIDGISLQDFDVTLLNRTSHVEQHYANNICCLDSDLFFVITENESGVTNLVKLLFSGKVKNIKGETLAEWDAKTIGEQLILLQDTPIFLIEYSSDGSLAVYEIGKCFVDNYSLEYESRRSHN